MGSAGGRMSSDAQRDGDLSNPGTLSNHKNSQLNLKRVYASACASDCRLRQLRTALRRLCAGVSVICIYSCIVYTLYIRVYTAPLFQIHVIVFGRLLGPLPLGRLGPPLSARGCPFARLILGTLLPKTRYRRHKNPDLITTTFHKVGPRPIS